MTKTEAKRLLSKTKLLESGQGVRIEQKDGLSHGKVKFVKARV